jgi:hypothetical protein
MPTMNDVLGLIMGGGHQTLYTCHRSVAFVTTCVTRNVPYLRGARVNPHADLDLCFTSVF